MNLRILLSRIRALFTREPRLDEEIATHISLLAADYERRGMSARDAHLAALREFGGIAQMRESYREQRRPPLIDPILQDVSYSMRQLRKSPVFAAAAVLTLGLGLGANMAVFRMLDTVLLRPLPVPHPEELVQLQPLDFGKPTNFSFPAYRDLMANQQVVTGFFAMGDLFPHRARVAGGRDVKLRHAQLVTGGYFSSLGVQAAMGRVLSEEDDRQGRAPVAVLSYRFWEHEWGRAPDAVGKVLEIDSTPVTIVGVAPRNFVGERVLFTPDVWLPMSLQPRLMAHNWLNAANTTFADVAARLRPGVSRVQAQAALDLAYRRTVGGESWQQKEQYHLQVVPASHGIVLREIQKTFGDPLWVMMCTVGLVLVIACCNLANLVLARGAARTHEMGVRLAMGASRARLVRQLLAESLVLSTLGTALGIVLAHWGTVLLLRWAEAGEFELERIFDWRVLGFMGTVATGCTCLFGVAPAIEGARLDIRSALQANRRTQSQGKPRQLMGKVFVVAQVSICLMLLMGSVLLARSLKNLEQQDWGFRPQGLLLADLPMDPSVDLNPDAARTRQYVALAGTLIEKLGALPAVSAVALAYGGPLGHSASTDEISTPDRPPRESDHARLLHVSPGFFESMGIPLIAGHGITAADRENSAAVAVIGETAARTVFPGQSALGRYLSLSQPFQARDALQIVGVARDVHLQSASELPGILIFVPLAQRPLPFDSVFLRTRGDAAALAESVRAVLREVDRDLAIGEIRPVTEMLDDQLNEIQLLTLLSGCFALLALALASIGLYGVISYAVTRRTQEIGIRLALGSTRPRVVGLVMREVGLLLAMGIGLGVCGSVGGLRAMRTLLFGISARDSGWLVLAGAFLVLVAACAAYVPARRAARLNPLDALRQE